jgi:basic amino acid/polyamine antiporter, APA family
MTQVQSKAEAKPANRSAMLGLTQSTVLVMGSIIGVGIFSLPYALASYGPISLFAMAIATVGAIALAMMFAVMSRRLPADGGPYAYARACTPSRPSWSRPWDAEPCA